MRLERTACLLLDCIRLPMLLLFRMHIMLMQKG